MISPSTLIGILFDALPWNSLCHSQLAAASTKTQATVPPAVNTAEFLLTNACTPDA
jgi:hypothetical protein